MSAEGSAEAVVCDPAPPQKKRFFSSPLIGGACSAVSVGVGANVHAGARQRASCTPEETTPVSCYRSGLRVIAVCRGVMADKEGRYGSGVLSFSGGG